MGGAPSGLCNMYVFHGLFAGAAREGLRRAAGSDWGNYAFSDKGYWGFVEYLLHGRWRQLWLALAQFPVHERSMAVALCRAGASCRCCPTRCGALSESSSSPNERSCSTWCSRSPSNTGGLGGAAAPPESGIVFERYQPGTRSTHRQLLLAERTTAKVDEIYQAFEQMYGIAQRDPMAYRPLVEYCWGCPPSMFMRDGEMRWPAKHVAKGIDAGGATRQPAQRPLGCGLALAHRPSPGRFPRRSSTVDKE